MHILLLTDGLFPYVLGGMQKHSTILAKQLAENDIQITLVHPGGDGYSRENFVREFGNAITEVVVPFVDNSKLPGHYIRATKNYAKSISQAFPDLFQFDLIYAQGFTADCIVERTDRPPILLNLHGLEMFQEQSNFKSKIDAWRLRKIALKNLELADYIYSFGGHLSDFLKKMEFDDDKLLLQMNGISSEWISNKALSKNTCRKFVFVGRQERRKGVQELNLALEMLIRKGAQFQFEFIGPIDQYFSDSSQVVYHGVIKEQEQIIKILDQSDCLVCPSFSEGMPTVIAEAMARGCAIIATDVGAVSRQFENNGVLLEQPEPSAIAKAITDLVEMTAEEFYQLRLNSLEKAKNEFTWEKIIQQKIEDFKKILS